ncbi:MAG: hypothetical protein CMP34_00155 [Rickettsiales bacterium]|nr:hypothetical protein [Rickettsiales bacterium]
MDIGSQLWLTMKTTAAMATKNPIPRIINALVGNFSRRVEASQTPNPAIAKAKKLNKVRTIPAFRSTTHGDYGIEQNSMVRPHLLFVQAHCTR